MHPLWCDSLYALRSPMHLPTASMLTLAEAATLLGVTPDTLRQQIASGSLKARKIGPIWTVSEREVERYRRENKRPA